jgi:hypothetical protein
MAATIKVLVYCLFILVMVSEEYNVPVMLHLKRLKFLADWKLAAYAQRQAIGSYLSYQDEAEKVRGGF